ncbi:hypothetical protein C1H84_08880 [Glutamicibacter soli]|uniref:Uncharacterized protein n=2 Tax=Glutamicibacter soli TaxID=453836 RepID=A0A365YIT0_9MICC|nr:hypothetical protein C1H84_08880 [Glutamicibacter soli]
MKMAIVIFDPTHTEGDQQVIYDDQTQLTETAAYTVLVPEHRQTGIYAGVCTVQDHKSLIEEFTDDSVFEGIAQ